MNKNLLKGVLFSILALSFFSCGSDNDDDTWERPQVSTGAYILNSGAWNGNDANLTYYNIETSQISKNVFKNQNGGLKIGDTGQSMLIYGSKMYIAATVTDKIYVTDREATLLTYSDGSKAIINPKDKDNAVFQPRYFAAYQDKVYATMQSGHVARIDTASMKIEATVKVGSFPEQMVVVGNKLYVVNSGQENDNTVSIINLNSFSEIEKIIVGTNPVEIIKDRFNNLYVLTWGKYGGEKGKLQKVNPNTNAVSTITENMTTMCLQGDKLLLMSKDWDNFTANFSYYNTATGEYVNESFVEETGLDLSLAGYISVDPDSKNIYITTSAYSANGDMYIFSPSGVLIKKFDTGGINPMGAFFVTHNK